VVVDFEAAHAASEAVGGANLGGEAARVSGAADEERFAEGDAREETLKPRPE
jgi:hypothetical protein